jgi:hypothetical protein
VDDGSWIAIPEVALQRARGGLLGGEPFGIRDEVRVTAWVED